MKLRQPDVPSNFWRLKPWIYVETRRPPSRRRKGGTDMANGSGRDSESLESLLSESQLPYEPFLNCCDRRFWWLVNLYLVMGYTTRRGKMWISVMSRHLTVLKSKSHQEILMQLCIFTESIQFLEFPFSQPSSQPGFALVCTSAYCPLDTISISTVILYFYSHSLLYPGEVSRQNRTVALPGSTMAGPKPLYSKWKLRFQTENRAPWLHE